MQVPTLQQIIHHSKLHGFLFPSSEIYEGLQAVYDYGPYGVLLKRKVQAFWWQSMTQCHRNIVGLDAAILMDPTTWEASGHVAGFKDWLVDNKTSKKRYRVDLLLESKAEAWKAAGEVARAQALLDKMHDCLAKEDGAGLTELLSEAGVVCPLSQSGDWTQAKQFNLMFATHVGPTAEKSQPIYLRPETAQGIFVNFLNVQKTTRQQIPFGIAQIGKAFRNEIVARQFIFRMREFEQMEMQFFIHPSEEAQWFEHWVAKRQKWYGALGIPTEALRLHPHEQLAHYAKAAVDVEYAFPFGFKELEGIHSRGDFDLRSHAAKSGKKLQYFDPKRLEAYIPSVVETSVGSDRLLLALLCHAFTHTIQHGKERTFLNFAPPLAPIGAAILPLLKKEPLVAQAKALFQKLCGDFSLAYDERGSIGKRYIRQDLLGTPHCITVDYDALEDQKVTIRDRNSMAQVRIPIEQVPAYLSDRLAMRNLLQKI